MKITNQDKYELLLRKIVGVYGTLENGGKVDVQNLAIILFNMQEEISVIYTIIIVIVF